MSAFSSSLILSPQPLSSLPECSRCAGDALFVFSRLQPALVTRFDLTYPGVTAANYLASLWYLFWMCLFFPCCFLVVVVVVFVVVVHPYSGTLRLCQCSDTVWHPHEIFQRVWITDRWVFNLNLPLKKPICAVKSHLFSPNMVDASEINVCDVHLFFLPVMFVLGLICRLVWLLLIFDDFYCLWGTLTIERNLCWFLWVCRCVWMSIYPFLQQSVIVNHPYGRYSFCHTSGITLPYQAFQKLLNAHTEK